MFADAAQIRHLRSLGRSWRSISREMGIAAETAKTLLESALGIGSLLFLRALNESLGIVRQSTAYYAELYCYAGDGAVVVFFAIRAEMRWRRSIR